MNILTLVVLAQTGVAGGADLTARVNEDLNSVAFVLEARLPRPAAGGTLFVHFPGNHSAVVPEPLAPASERDAFISAVQLGGFYDVSITVNGVGCAPPQNFELRVACGALPPGPDVSVSVRGRLDVPERYGPFGVREGQLTLGGGWHPTVSWDEESSPQLDFQLLYEGPGDHPIVFGPRFHPPKLEPGVRRQVTARTRARSVALVVLPPFAGNRRLAPGARLISKRALRRGDQDFALAARESAKAAQDSLLFLQEEGFAAAATEILIVEAPLRHELVRALPSVVLISDRAFRLLPFERFLRFHRFPLVREIFTAWALARNQSQDVVAGEALGAWLRDRYVAKRAGRAENAFDVLGFWGFLPTVDSILYAPQVPFVSAYFRVLGEGDPLVKPLVDPTSKAAHGRLLHDKLSDRLAQEDLRSLFMSVVSGATLKAASAPFLGDAVDEFFTTWLGPPPSVQYELTDFSSRPGRRDECDGCWVAEATVRRTGKTLGEPIEVVFVDNNGKERSVWTSTSVAEFRSVSATLSADLDLVELDPRGRVFETPTDDNPSPRFDNRSRPRWRWLLNNVDFTWSPSSGNLSTSLDIGLSRLRDVRWRFGARAFYGPEAYGASARAVYGFGSLATPARLNQWVGFAAAAERLRANFGGSEGEATAASTALFYGYDDRQTLWAPEAGRALRFAVGYDHVFAEPTPDSGQTRGAVSFSVSGLRSWRLAAAHQISVRASLGSFISGRPRPQLLYALGGRRQLRGYVEDDRLGRVRAVTSAEWVHPILPELDWNGVWLGWITGLDGALFVDAAAIDDGWKELSQRSLRADVGYGIRLYLDYFGVQEGVVALDVALPLLDDDGRFAVGGVQVYIDFVQSYFVF